MRTPEVGTANEPEVQQQPRVQVKRQRIDNSKPTDLIPGTEPTDAESHLAAPSKRSAGEKAPEPPMPKRSKRESVVVASGSAAQHFDLTVDDSNGILEHFEASKNRREIPLASASL